MGFDNERIKKMILHNELAETVQYLLHPEDIDDPILASLWKKARDALDEIVNYLKV